MNSAPSESSGSTYRDDAPSASAVKEKGSWPSPHPHPPVTCVT
jgi:hypothetical protein